MRSATMLLALLLAVAAPGCSSRIPARGKSVPKVPDVAGVRCLFDEDDVKRGGVRLGPDFGVTPRGDFLVQTSRNIHATGTWIPVAAKKIGPLFRFTVDPEGTIYVITGTDFGMLVSGAFIKITGMPGPGFRVAAAPGDLMYLYGGGAVYILRKDKKNTTVQHLLTVEGSIDALAPAGLDFFFVQGNRLFRAGVVKNNRVAVAPILSLDQEESILSIAFDPDRTMLFLATRKRTLVMHHGTVAPILGFGGVIAVGGKKGDRLYVYQPDDRRAFVVNIPKLLASLAKPQ